MTSPATSETEGRFTLTDDGPCKRRLEVRVQASAVEAEAASAARRLAKGIRLPGFRRGKVPASVVRQRFAPELKEEVIERLASRLVPPYLKEKGLSPVAAPVVEKENFQPGQDLDLTVMFEIDARFEIGEYRGLKAARPGAVVEEAKVDEALESVRQGLARLRSIEDRGAAQADEVQVELHGEYVEGAEAGESFRRPDLRIRIGTEDLHPDLSGALMGARVGEERQVRIRYPDDYRTRELAGRLIHYRMQVQAIQERRLPALDDDLAREAGDFENLAALRDRVRSDLENDRRDHAEESVRQELLRQLIASHQFAVPQVLVERETRRRLEQTARHLALQGVDPAQAGIKWEKEAERLRARVVDDIRAGRILDAIAERESIDPDPERVEKFFAAEAKRAKKSPAALRATWRREGQEEAILGQLRREGVLDFLVSVGHIHEEGKSA